MHFVIGWRSMLYQSTKYRAEVKLLQTAKLHYVLDYVLDFSLFFFALIGSEISEQASWQVATEE